MERGLTLPWTLWSHGRCQAHGPMDAVESTGACLELYFPFGPQDDRPASIFWRHLRSVSWRGEWSATAIKKHVLGGTGDIRGNVTERRKRKTVTRKVAALAYSCFARDCAYSISSCPQDTRISVIRLWLCDLSSAGRAMTRNYVAKARGTTPFSTSRQLLPV